MSQHDEASRRSSRPQWMREARLGLFIHWGLDSVAARHEWVKQHAQNTTMGGMGADVLTLTLPVRSPDMAVPVIELFLEPGQ